MGDKEVLIIPHRKLFEVPWAALFDSRRGQYLIERYVLRVAPSLCVARTAADTLRDIKGQEEKGHALVVGSQLPTRSVSLPEAEVEAKFVAELLNGVGFEVHAASSYQDRRTKQDRGCQVAAPCVSRQL